MTGVWKERLPTELMMSGGDSSYVVMDERGHRHDAPAPGEIRIADGRALVAGPSLPRYAWHEVAVDEFFTDEALTQRFTGVLRPAEGQAVATDGTRYGSLHGLAAENGAPLTMNAFGRGLPGQWGKYIVVVSVLLFAISTAISWCYYGDRCANYLFGPRAIQPYRLIYVLMHFFGSVVSLSVVWEMGDIALGLVIVPNLIALVLLSGQVKQMTDSYFERKPWLESAAVHRKLESQGHRK
jgi:AGCS family alanine or glycine:cation symporter